MRFASSAPHRVEVDVRHGGDQRLLGEQRAGVEALLEEVAGAVVLEVGAPRDGLLEVLHEVRHRTEGAPGARQAVRVAEHEFAAFGLELRGDGAALGRRERLEPPPGDLLVGPVAVGEGVVAQHQVEVVAEHGVGVDVDGEAGRELAHALDEPGAAVGVVAPLSWSSTAAQEGAADAARHEVVVAFVDGVDEQVSRGGHAPMVPANGFAGVTAVGHGCCKRPLWIPVRFSPGAL